MQTLNLYKQFAKKENSTKVPPSGTLTLSLQGILKEPCSIMTPVITIKRLPADANPGDYTYARWVEADRYYFVEDWVWADGLWEVHMKEDVLATFKSDIGNSTEYVLRTDSTTNFNDEITDTTYPATTNITTRVVENTTPFTPATISSGCFVVGIISGGNTNAVGAISYFVMNDSQFGALKDKLFSDDNLEIMGIIDAGGQQLVTDLSQEILKTLYNPYQYIASCMWFPIDTGDIVNKDPVTSIKIGWWPYPLNGWVLTYPMMILTERTMALQNHPQSAARGSYLNYAPYTRHTLYGRFGTVPLDTAFFESGDSIQVRYNVDLITGQCRAIVERVRPLATDFITEKNFLVGVPIQIAQVGTDYLGTYSTAISTGAIAGQQAATLNVGGAIATLTTGIYNTIQSQMPQLETDGTNGSFLSTNVNSKLVSLYYNIVDEDIAHRGRPLCELRQLSTLSGFILCAEGEIDISCYDNERKEIVQYLTNGFFWE